MGNKYSYNFRIGIVINVLAICQILKILWHFVIFVNVTGLKLYNLIYMHTVLSSIPLVEGS